MEKLVYSFTECFSGYCMGLGRRRWLGLVIGNSRWHWGAFESDALSTGMGAAPGGDAPGAALGGDRWLGAWHTAHLSQSQVRQLQQSYFAPITWQQLGLETPLPIGLATENIAGSDAPELWVASVVAAPLPWLANYPALHPVELAQVPLQNTYPTLGVDRALALVGAGATWGWPVLVIDCGTALTFTAGADQRLIGGAILPGLGLQLRSLQAHTDQLPMVELTPRAWPQRWATNTAEAIASGTLYTLLAGICDFIAAWEADWPGGTVVLTGGDSGVVLTGLTERTPDLAQRIKLDLDLGFWGLRICRARALDAL